MKRTIIIPDIYFTKMMDHLFQNNLEQAAFLFATEHIGDESLELVVEDIYLVPEDGWDDQRSLYLQMKDTERAKIMNIARVSKYCVIDCHSHPKSKDKVWFSISDVSGTKDFASYAKWKLDGRPFAAVVVGESSLDAMIWHGHFDKAKHIDFITVIGKDRKQLFPRRTWDEDHVLKDRINK